MRGTTTAIWSSKLSIVQEFSIVDKRVKLSSVCGVGPFHTHPRSSVSTKDSLKAEYTPVEKEGFNLIPLQRFHIYFKVCICEVCKKTHTLTDLTPIHGSK